MKMSEMKYTISTTIVNCTTLRNDSSCTCSCVGATLLAWTLQGTFGGWWWVFGCVRYVPAADATDCVAAVPLQSKFSPPRAMAFGLSYWARPGSHSLIDYGCVPITTYRGACLVVL